MTIIDKMDALCGLDRDAHIDFSPYTRKFYVSLKVEIGDGAVLCSPAEHRDSPADAIEAMWARLINLKPDEFIVIDAMNEKRREIRWVGFMWKDVKRS